MADTAITRLEKMARQVPVLIDPEVTKVESYISMQDAQLALVGPKVAPKIVQARNRAQDILKTNRSRKQPVPDIPIVRE